VHGLTQSVAPLLGRSAFNRGSAWRRRPARADRPRHERIACDVRRFIAGHDRNAHHRSSDSRSPIMRSQHQPSSDPRSTVPRGEKPAAAKSPRGTAVKKGQNAQTNATTGDHQPDYESRKRQARRERS
jgi:hypothetical protein